MLATPVRLSLPSAKAGHAEPRARIQVVVVALDGVRHQDVFGGVDANLAKKYGVPPERVVSGAQLMPHLHELMQRGAALGAPGAGSPISASGPDFVSLPGYSEILTGSTQSGCFDNACSGTRVPSIADELASQAHGGWHAAIITSWPDIARVAAQSSRVAVSSGRHGGATRSWFATSPAARAALGAAEDAAPWPGQGDFRRDRWTADLALAYLAEQNPNFMFVSLGEPDEFAHQGSYAGYLDALQQSDQRIGQLAAALDERARQGVRTALFVTTDHGRADGFRDHGREHAESARVWLVASGSAIGARGWVSAPAPRRLADIAPTIRQLFGLASPTGRASTSSGARGGALAGASADGGSPLTELLFSRPN